MQMLVGATLIGTGSAPFHTMALIDDSVVVEWWAIRKLLIDHPVTLLSERIGRVGPSGAKKNCYNCVNAAQKYSLSSPPGTIHSGERI